MKPWWEQEWYLEWLRLSKEDYHGKRLFKPLSYDDVVGKVVEELRSSGKRCAPFNKESEAESVPTAK